VTPEDSRAYLDRQAAIDPDIWILDIEDAQGSGLL